MTVILERPKRTWRFYTAIGGCLLLIVGLAAGVVAWRSDDLPTVKEAVAWEAEGHHTLAASALRVVLRERPAQAYFAHAYLGQWTLRDGFYIDARRHLSSALERGGSRDGRLALDLAMADLGLGRAGTAAEALNAHPEVVSEADFEAVSRLVAAVGEGGKALHERLEAIADSAPGASGFALLSARLALNNGRYAASERILAGAMQAHGPRPAFLWLDGDLAYQQRDFSRSLQRYRALQADGRRDGPFVPEMGIARAHIYLGDPEAATAILDRVLRDDPDSVAGHYLRSLADLRRGDFDGAFEHAQYVLGVAPGYHPALLLAAAAGLALDKLAVADSYARRYRARQGSTLSRELVALIERRRAGEVLADEQAALIARVFR